MKGPPVLLRLSRGFVTSGDLKIFLFQCAALDLKTRRFSTFREREGRWLPKIFLCVCLINFNDEAPMSATSAHIRKSRGGAQFRSREKWHFTVAVERRSGNHDTGAIPAAASCLLLLRFSPVFAWSNPLGRFQLQFVPFCLYFLERFRLHASCNSWCL